MSTPRLDSPQRPPQAAPKPQASPKALTAYRPYWAKRSGGDHHFLFLVVVFIALLWSPLLWVWGPAELPRWQARDWAL
ncbi:MAG: hypothetical protein ACKOFK_06890, partial [Betaproteobacteria bacterium]